MQKKLRVGGLYLAVLVALCALPMSRRSLAGSYTALSEYAHRYIPVTSGALPANCAGNDCAYVNSVDDTLYFKNQSGVAVPVAASPNASVSPAGYTNANVTVDQFGRITGITNGLAPAGGGYTTTQYNASNLTQRSALNFQGTGMSCVDNSGSSRTDCTPTPLAFINVKDPPYNAKADGATDDSTPIQSALTAACVSGGVVYLPPTSSSYYVKTGLTIPCSYVTVEGARHTSTVIKFDPTSAASALTFGVADGTERYGDTVRGLKFVSTGGNTQQKIAVTVIDISGFVLEDIWVDPITSSTWTSSGTSIGLLIEGREIGSYSRYRAFTDKPIVFRDDPNTTGIVDNDQTHVFDVYLRPTPSTGNAAITIETGQIVTNLNLDGVQEYVVDKYGINWTDTNATTVSSGVRIQGVRCEQAVDPTGWCININRTGTAALQNLVIDDMTAGVAQNGVQLAGVLNTTIRDSHFNANTSSYTHLNIGSGVFSVDLRNNYVQTSALTSFGGLTQSMQAPMDFNGTATMPATALYLNTTAATIMKALATATVDSINGSTQLCLGCSTAPSVALGLNASGTVFIRSNSLTGISAGATIIGGAGAYMGDVRSRHFTGQGSAPSSAAGTGAGTSPTLAVTGTDAAGKIALTLGTTPAGSNAIIGTMTFSSAYNINAPYCQITPTNAAAVALTGATVPFVDQASTTVSVFVMKSGATALSGGPFLWNYDCTQ